MRAESALSLYVTWPLRLGIGLMPFTASFHQKHYDCDGLIIPGTKITNTAAVFLMKWGCKGHWGYGGCWGCRGYWGCKGSRAGNNQQLSDWKKGYWSNFSEVYLTISDEPEPEFSSSSRAELWRFRAEPSWGTLIFELKPSWIFFWYPLIVSFLGPRKKHTNINLYY